MEKKRKENINVEEVNEVVGLTKKILKTLYVVMIIGIVFLATILIREWGILTFILGILSVISPLFIGFAIAWIFNPVVKKLEKKGIPRIAGSLIIYAIFLLILFIFIRVFVPTVYDQINDLIGNLPSIFNDFKTFVNDFFTNLTTNHEIDLTNVKLNLIAKIEMAFESFATSLPEFLINLVMNFFSSLITIGFGLVIGLYMLFDFDAISKHFLNMIPKKNRFEMEVLLSNISAEVRKSLNGTLLVALLVFVCDAIGFSIIGLQGALLFGLFCGITDLIPYVGPYIGGIPAVIIGFSQSTFTGIMAAVIVIGVQLIENFIIQPVVMSKTMRLHPVTIMIGLLIFGHFFGIIGMILATPCIALLKVIYRFVVVKYNLFAEEPLLRMDEQGKIKE